MNSPVDIQKEVGSADRELNSEIQAHLEMPGGRNTGNEGLVRELRVIGQRLITDIMLNRLDSLSLNV